LLDMTLRDLEKDPLLRELRCHRAGPDPAQYRELLNETVPQRARRVGDDAFRADIGAEAIRAMLQVIDLNEERRGCARSCATRLGGQAQEAGQALKLVESFIESGAVRNG